MTKHFLNNKKKIIIKRQFFKYNLKKEFIKFKKKLQIIFRTKIKKKIFSILFYGFMYIF